MDEMKTILASEGIKSLLQKEIKKPISFLESSLNEVKALLKDEMKKSKDMSIELQNCIGALSGEIQYLRSSNSELVKQLTLCQEKIALMSPREWTEGELRKNNERIAKILSDSTEYRKMNDKRARSLHGLSWDMEDKQRLFELDVGIIKDALEKSRKELNQIKVSEKEHRTTNDKSREEFLTDSKCLLGLMRLQMDEQKIKSENIYKLVQKSDKRIKQDSVDLSKDLLEKFGKFENDFDKRIDEIKHKRKDICDELDRIDQQMQKSTQGGKSIKELDDFMKQVSFNARQIAKIQQSLEGE